MNHYQSSIDVTTAAIYLMPVTEEERLEDAAHQLIHNGRLQRQLDVLPEWLRKWRVAINTEKSEAISFTCHWKTSVNYLDVELCDK